MRLCLMNIIIKCFAYLAINLNEETDKKEKHFDCMKKLDKPPAAVLLMMQAY